MGSLNPSPFGIRPQLARGCRVFSSREYNYRYGDGGETGRAGKCQTYLGAGNKIITTDLCIDTHMSVWGDISGSYNVGGVYVMCHPAGVAPFLLDIISSPIGSFPIDHSQWPTSRGTILMSISLVARSTIFAVSLVSSLSLLVFKSGLTLPPCSPKQHWKL